MSKQLSLTCGLAAVLLLHAGCGEPESAPSAPDEAIQAVYEGRLTVPQAQVSCGCRLELVPIGGTVGPVVGIVAVAFQAKRGSPRV